jgi:type IV secretion/conjugal transfer VirB4 family ATPase
MQPISSVFGNPGQSDPLSRWIPYSCFVDRDVFSTKTGHIGMTLEMEGLEYETLSQENLERVAEQFTAAHRVFDGRFRLYHHFVKRNGERVSRQGRYSNSIVERAINERAEFLERAGLYSIRLFTTVVFESDPAKPSSIDECRAQSQLSLRLAANIQILKDAVASYAAALGSLLGITILDKFGIFEHLCLLANPVTDLIPRLKYDEHVDYFAANTEVQQRKDYLDWGGYQTRVFALKEEPSATFAHMLRALMKIESNCILAYEWKRESNLTMTQLLRGKRDRTWGQRFGATKKAEFAIADKASSDKAERLNDALAQIQAEGNCFGHFSLIAVVFDQDTERLRRAVGSLISCFRDREATLIEEHKHRMRSFFAILPGNKLNIRYRYLLNRNYADLVPLYRPSGGTDVNEHLDGEYLTVLQSTDGTPFYFNLHVGQVAASLVTGTTGSGKSVLMNQLIEDSQKYEGIRTFIVDVGRSYRALTKKYGGTYISVSLKERNFHINPFRQPYSPQNVNAIKQLILCFLANEKHEPTSEERQEIHEAIHEVYSLSESRRRLGKISLRKDLKKALHLWINNGPLSHVFDNEQDDLQVSNWSTWDYTDLEESPEVLAPLMFYQLHWVGNVVRDSALASVPKALWCDEGWRFGGSIMADLIRTAAKTWRKHNAWCVFATQDEIDLRNSGLLEALSAACHTKIFLPNPGADLSVYGSTFKLTEREQQLLEEMRTGEMLIKTPRESRRLRLQLSKTRLEEYSNQFLADDSAELQEAFK